MDVSLIIRVAGVGFLVSLAVQVLNKTGREELSGFVTVAGILVVFCMLLGKIRELFAEIASLFSL